MEGDADATRSQAPAVADSRAPRTEASPGDTFVDDPERYAVEHQIGAGGMGAVYAATGSRFGRQVALKLITIDREDLRKRFEREAQVTARLQHPSIVPVYGAGAGRDGLPFYAMKQVSGEPLDKVIRSTASLAQRLALLPKVIAVADAIAYAHAQRVIHRDLKPANILVGAFGETIIIDWGLAKDLTGPDDADTVSPYRSGNADETAIGKVMGTPAYMPREQARGERVDERADVYALGAILYHLLAGRAPFTREGEQSIPWESMLARVLAEEPPPLPADVPADLVAIVTRAMAPSPDARYPSAGELAEDLRKFQTGQLVGAHRYTTWQLARRWVRKYRTPLYVAGVALAVLAVLAVISVQRIVDERDRADEARGVAETERGEADTQRATAIANEAEAAKRADELTLLQAHTLLERDPTSAIAFLKTLGPTFIDWDHVWLIAVAARGANVASRVVIRDRDVGSVSLSSDGRFLVTSAIGREMWVYDLVSGDKRTLTANDTVYVTRFLPDGRTLASSGEEHDIRLWNVVDGKPVGKLVGHAKRIDGFVIAKDGKRIVSTSADGTARLWDVATGKSVQLAGRLAGRAFTVTLLNDTFAAASLQHVQVWDLGKPDAEPRAFDIPKPIKGLLVTPDGREIATTDRSVMAIRLTEIATGKVRELVDPDAHDTYLTRLVPSPDGTRLGAGGGDGRLRVWELASGKRVANIAANTAAISVFGFMDDATAMSCSEDGTCGIVDLGTGTTLAHFIGHGGPIVTGEMSKDRATLVTGSRDHTARVWSVPRHSRWVAARPISHFDFAPDGATIAVGGAAGLQLWSPADDRHTTITDKPVSTPRYSHDGKRLAWGDDSKAAVVRDLATGRETVLAGHTESVWGVSFSPDDTQLATSGLDKTIRIWDLASGTSTILGSHDEISADVAFAPDGKHLASVGFDNTLRIWDLATKTARVIKLNTQIFNVAYAPDGKTLSLGANDAVVRLVDVATGAIRQLQGHRGVVYYTAWSRDGRLLASGSADGSVFVWDVASGTGEPLRGHHRDVEHVAFAPDGRRLASVSNDEHTLIVWDLDIPRDPIGLRGWLDIATDATIDTRGQLR